MKYLIELQSQINQFNKTSPQRRTFIENYVGGGQSDLNYLGLRIPQVRSVLKQKLQLFDQNLKKQFQVFEMNWFNSKTFETKALSLFWLEGLEDQQLVQFARPLLRWANDIDNWAHSDSLCGVYARIFEKAPQLFLPSYKKWNQHQNPWLRRISMVGLMYYARQRERHPSFSLCLQMIESHWADDHYYVQKAVGWTLREMYNVYPDKTLFLIEKKLECISSVAWVAASEKLPLKYKNKLVQKRRLSRQLLRLGKK